MYSLRPKSKLLGEKTMLLLCSRVFPIQNTGRAEAVRRLTEMMTKKKKKIR